MRGFMNKEYIYVNGKIVVLNEEGMRTPIEYSDNLDDILVSENLIEEMESKQQELESNLKVEVASKKNNKMMAVMILAVFSLGSLIIPNLLTTAFGINEIIETIFGSMTFLTAMTISMVPLFTFVGLLISSLPFTNYLISKKTINGLNSEIEFLSKRLSKEKERLINLQNEKGKNKEEKIKQIDSSMKVSDKEALEELKSYLQLYYDCGYNGEKYSRYYMKGKLHNKLSRNYTDLGVRIIEEQIEEKGFQKTLRQSKILR